MSTNITNTNNGTHNGASRPKSSGQKPGSSEGSQRFPFASIPLPDPALLERLANEFFSGNTPGSRKREPERVTTYGGGDRVGRDSVDDVHGGIASASRDILYGIGSERSSFASVRSARSADGD